MTPGDVASAYDAIAADYDRQVHGDEWMRRVLWQRYDSLFQSGQRVLDVSCGTGLDAVFLTSRGIAVTAIDVSPGMIAQLELKVSRLELTNRIDARVLDVGQLALLPAESFDGIISAFAGLNTLADLSPFAADASRLLRPGGKLLLHLLNRFSLWEYLRLLGRGEWRAAQGLGRHGERVFVIGRQPVRHSLWSADEAFQRFFARDFRLLDRYSLGSLRPPHTVHRLPSPLIGALGGAERLLRHRRPFVNWGRFFVLELQKSGEATRG
ncbi:MAG TPA: class I SAM-dependent methyltransferase [Chloroflexota bacterium]|nr:class I SAM-dependent methyltransferase [Chloroflexota bacterium]